MSAPIDERGAAVARRIALALLAAVALPSAVHANPRAEAVLAQMPFSDGERKRILAGELVTTASREKTSDRELAITMAFLINNPPADLAAMFQKAAAYETEKNVTAHGELRGAGSLADLQALRLAPNGDSEAQRFAGARAGDDLNLSSAEIAALRALSVKTTAAIEEELHTLLLARFQAYRARGVAGIAPYDRGGGKSSNPAEDLTRATKASQVLAREAPEVVTALLDFPKSQPPKATERFFWVNFASQDHGRTDRPALRAAPRPVQEVTP